MDSTNYGHSLNVINASPRTKNHPKSTMITSSEPFKFWTAQTISVE